MATAKAAMYAGSAKEKWRSSNISDHAAKKLKLRELSAKETKALAANFEPARSMFLPYFDLKGKQTKFYRIRYIEPLPGFAALTETRYEQPRGTINEVYYPPVLKKSWEAIAADPAIDLIVTEGELKAVAGCLAGYATLGLGGVDVWRASKAGLDLLPSLEKFVWKDRSVVFVFDSDLAEKPDVVRAQRKFAKELLARGARPSFAGLPPAKDGSKQGLDDYLVAQGEEALQAVIESAPAFLEAYALWEMNEDFIWVKDPGLIVERKTGQRIAPSMFVKAHAANRHYIKESVKGSGKEARTVQEKKPLAAHWLGWEQRAEAQHITYAPGRPQLYKGTWNTWRGWGCEPKKGDVTLWKQLLDHLFDSQGGKEARKWFEQWCAYPLQHPGEKMYTACLLLSNLKGIGKTLIAYTLMGIYGANSVEIKSNSLEADFNEWQKDHQFVYGDEITAGESRRSADWLNGTITQHTVTINDKFIPKYTVPDHMNYLFTSNHLDALFIDSLQRRYFIWEILKGLLPPEFYRSYDRWLGWDKDSGIAKGEAAPALFHHLLNLDLTGFHPKAHAPETPGKQAMVHAGRNELSLWIEDMKIDPFRVFRAFGDKAAAECEVMTPRMILRAFDPEGKTKHTEISVGRALWAAGVPRLNDGLPVRTKAGILRFYAVRNLEEWKRHAKPDKIRKAFEKFFGPEAGRY